MLGFSEVLGLLEHWVYNPPANEMLQVLAQEKRWERPRMKDEEGSSSSQQISEFMSVAGGDVHPIQALPAHLQLCLRAAQKAIATGKAN